MNPDEKFIFIQIHGPITGKDGVCEVKTYLEYVRDAASICFEKKLSAKAAACQIVASDAFRGLPFAHWDSPERMMTNVHLLYRQFRGRTGHMSTPAKVNLMRKQALLAHTKRALPKPGSLSVRPG